MPRLAPSTRHPFRRTPELCLIYLWSSPIIAYVVMAPCRYAEFCDAVAALLTARADAVLGGDIARRRREGNVAVEFWGYSCYEYAMAAAGYRANQVKQKFFTLFRQTSRSMPTAQRRRGPRPI